MGILRSFISVVSGSAAQNIVRGLTALASSSGCGWTKHDAPILPSFHPPERRTLALQRSFDVGPRTRQARHYGADRHALDVGDLAIAHALQHHQQQHRALLLDER